MAIESIIEWIQTNQMQTELIAIQLTGIVGLGYAAYKCYTERNEPLARKDIKPASYSATNI